MTLYRAIATVGGFTMLSRIVGLARDILIAAMVGAGPVGDAFFVAFKIPNLFRRLFAEGAFSAAFVPLFSEALTSDGKPAARAFAGEALAALLVALGVVLAAFEISMPWLMYALAPGFAADPARFDLAVQLTRITFPYLIFISVVSLLGGVLNSLGKFAAGAVTPVLLNLCLIGALLALTPVFPTPGHALAWGVAAAGVVQLIWVVVAVWRAGALPRLRRPRLTPRVRELGRRVLPAAVGSGVAQINIAVDIILASLLPAGSISFLFFADRLTQLPLGVVGAATGTALLPLLSRHIVAGDEAAASEDSNRAVEVALLFALPAAVALMVAAEPIVRVLFERGAFDALATRATALAVIAYAAGVPAYVLVKVLSPCFFARKDTRTPVKVAIWALLANIVLNVVLMIPLKHAGLALATALSAWLNAGLLGWLLVRRGHFVADARLRRALPRLALAAAGLGLGIWLAATSTWLEAPLSGSAGERVGALAALVLGGLVLYGALVQITGAARLDELRAMIRRGPSG